MFKRVLNIILLFSLHAYPFLVYGQKILDPEIRPVNQRFDNFIVMGGEANQSTTALMFDSKGFLWSGTETGLYRFDGIKYIGYSGEKYDSSGYAGTIITALYEDSDNNIWIGTSGALNKLDLATGRFRHFHPYTIDSLSKSDSSKSPRTNNIIRLIREDKDGLLWIMTNGNIFSFDKKSNTFTEYMTDALAWRNVSETFGEEPERFLIDKKDNKWFATRYGLFRYSDSLKKFSHLFPHNNIKSELEHYSVNCLAEDIYGTVWLGSDRGGLFRWDPENDCFKETDYYSAAGYSSPFGKITAIKPDRSGRLWIFGGRRFSIFDPVTGKSLGYIIKTYPRAGNDSGGDGFARTVFHHKDGSAWFLDKGNGLMFRFDPGIELLSLYMVPFWVVYNCLMDETGSFWFGCIRNNILRLSTNQAQYNRIYVQNTSSVDQGASNRLATDINGRMWLMLSNETDTFRLPDNFRAPKLGKVGLNGMETQYASVYRDTRNDLWFGGRNGEVICSGLSTGIRKKYNLYHPYADMTKETIRKITEDKNGNIWVACLEHGIFRLDRNKGKFSFVIDYNDLPKNPGFYLSDFLIDSIGDIWILNFQGITRVKMPEMTMTNYSEIATENNLVTAYFIRIKEDKDGKIWLLNCNTGLYSYDRKSDIFNPVDIHANLRDAFYFDLLADSSNRLWIANNAGITIYSPEKGHSRTIKTTQLQYDFQGYLVPGHVIYLSWNELFVFDLDVPVNDMSPPVFITGMQVNGLPLEKLYPELKEIRSLNRIDLPFRQNSLRIEFAALNYLNPQYNNYRFFLKGFDDDTVFSGKANYAEYKKIKPGSYTFWASGSNNDNVWNREGVSIDIVVHPPFYRTIPAYIFYSVFFISLLYAYIWRVTTKLKREKKKLEAEVKLRTMELEVKNIQLEEMDKLKTRFFTDVSHEIRTPLSLILGPLESLLYEDHLDDKTSNIIGVMKRNGQRLSQLVNQMLDISRLDSGKMKIYLAESDLTVFLRMLVYDFVSFAETRKIKYLVELPEKHHVVCFDRDKLEKIITNLLSNAFKFTPSGCTVTCRIKYLPAIGENDPDKLLITVADTGTGIDSENLEKIFDRFFKVDDVHDSHKGGTGIGLSITRDLVNVLHGTINVSSEVGKGTVFELSVPVGKEHLASDEYVITDPAVPQKSNHIVNKWKEMESFTNHIHDNSKQSILVIEDNEDLRNFIAENLETDYEVHTAENGKTGMSLGLSHIPDLVVTDIKMDGMDGLTLCSNLKNDERTSHIPVIILTARATQEEKMEGLNTGADDYLVKPFNMPELKVRISNLLTQREKLKDHYSRSLVTTLSTSEMESIDDKFMKKVVTIVNKRMSDFSFDVRSLQEELGMSRMHLFRKLKALTGIPPVTLIRNMRLEKAAKLISCKAGNITEIANSVGISNPSYFSKCFRDYFGVLPKDYTGSGEMNSIKVANGQGKHTSQ